MTKYSNFSSMQLPVKKKS